MRPMMERCDVLTVNRWSVRCVSWPAPRGLAPRSREVGGPHLVRCPPNRRPGRRLSTRGFEAASGRAPRRCDLYRCKAAHRREVSARPMEFDRSRRQGGAGCPACCVGSQPSSMSISSPCRSMCRCDRRCGSTEDRRNRSRERHRCSVYGGARKPKTYYCCVAAAECLAAIPSLLTHTGLKCVETCPFCPYPQSHCWACWCPAWRMPHPHRS